MNKVNVSCVCANELAKIPTYQHETDAGADMYSIGGSKLHPGQTKIFDTGIILNIPEGWEVQIRSRSGLAAKNGVFCLNSPGTIDSGYRDTIKVILHNAGEVDFEVKPGDRIAQAVIAPSYRMDFSSVDKADETDRGKGGLGSTGV